MPEWCWKIVYMFIGGLIGFFLACLCSISHDSDREIERIIGGKK